MRLVTTTLPGRRLRSSHPGVDTEFQSAARFSDGDYRLAHRPLPVQPVAAGHQMYLCHVQPALVEGREHKLSVCVWPEGV